MAPSVICCTLLQLFLLVRANDILTINPQNPIVPLGGSIKLNCSINSPLCTTNWKGLDTNLGGVYTAPGYSVLTIQNASISMEGTKICVTTCPAPGRSKNSQKSVSLQVYALPETLLLSTSTTNGNSYLHCLMKGMHPMVDIDVQCYKNSKKLGSYSDDITSDDELDIHNITWSWEISNEDLKSQTLYRCEAGLSIGERTFRRVGILEIPKEAGTTDTLARTVTDAEIRYDTENQNTSMTTRTPKTFSTTTDLTTLYTRTPKKWTPSSPSTSSSVTTHKPSPTSDTVRATDALDTTITYTENQNMTTFSTSTDSTTTVYTGTPKQKTPSPPSTMFISLTPRKELSTPNTDDISIIWMAVPAAGLAGSILLVLQIWRQLNKKGFFQPNQIHCSDCKHGAKEIV
ncbi:mucosal addressin cell adhesion molecule 1 isoform X2 [Rana temporaria]|uniref:mucosal addressin cell adhesion molecule 1 isoform X2 n=1 Tax=Rana temporaria TaxID=8407 RepID=UPI001AAD055A|nr:mucosal addressin cell adhesion molecule 1 isoform X2 [Rana temporaria]